MAATKSIEIRTEIPGPRSRELLARGERGGRKAAAGLPAGRSPPRRSTRRSRTSTATCSSTSRAGSACCNVGHCHPRVVEAIQEQAARFVHTDFTVVPYASYVELAERLGALVPIAGPTRAAFFNSGAEAVENAVKIARLAHGPAGRDRVRGRLPRPHDARDDDDLEGAPVQDRDGPVRAGGLPGAVPERVSRPVRPRRRWTRSSACSRPTSLRPRSPRSCSSRSSARAASCLLRPSSWQGLRAICDREGIVHGGGRGADGLRAHRPDVRDGALRRSRPT